MKLTDEQIDEIEARMALASPMPWMEWLDDDKSWQILSAEDRPLVRVVCTKDNDDTEYMKQEDVDFVCAATLDIPNLIETLKAHKATVDRLVSAISGTIATLHSWHNRPDCVSSNAFENLACELCEVEDGKVFDWAFPVGDPNGGFRTGFKELQNAAYARGLTDGQKMATDLTSRILGVGE